MIEQLILNYLNNFILKSGEELEWYASNNENTLMEVKIIKRSTRTYRIQGVLTLSPKVLDLGEKPNDIKLEALALTIRKKVFLDDLDRQTFKWLEEGWIIKEVRFEKDEKTLRSSHYRMGCRLYEYKQWEKRQKMDQMYNEFLELKNHVMESLSTKVVEQTLLYQQRKQMKQEIIKIMKQLDMDELESASFYFPQKWTLKKRLKFLQFVHAFSQLCLYKDEFDWKEIGAAYFRKIGGSKEFDSYKHEFIDQLEVWTRVQVDELGLTSLGQIIPVFFAGQLSGKFATYDWGTVHALTNVSLKNEVYHTKATTFWLVENRAILTRMAATGHFLSETNSLILCVDGHIRSTHRKAISQILNNSQIKQVLIWCDYDPDGLQISKEIYEVVHKHNDLTKKWVLPDQEVVDNWQQYEQHLLHLLKDHHMEQEQMMGGVDQWRKWILV